MPLCGLYRGLRNVIYQRLQLMSRMIIHIVSPRLIPANRTFHILFFLAPTPFSGYFGSSRNRFSSYKVRFDPSNCTYAKVGRCHATGQQPELSQFSERRILLTCCFLRTASLMLLTELSGHHLFLFEFALVCICKWQKQRALSQVRWG